ncbi:MAG: PIN domain-containing protein [Spirochaetia bacterium]|nr:PIN domain-containing protein [Spirochaetia bacterium]
MLDLFGGDNYPEKLRRFELFYGAQKSNNPVKSLALIREFFNSFSSMSFDDNIADICGEIRADLEKLGTPIGPYDLLIAATAISKDLILVTNNTKEFIRVKNIQLEDWQ